MWKGCTGESWINKHAPQSRGGSYQAIDIARKARRAISAEVLACNYECVLLFRRIVGLMEGSLTRFSTRC